MKITYLGNYFSDDKFPMRGIAQSLMREYCRARNLEYEELVLTSDYRNNSKTINSSSVVFINIDAAYDKDVYELINEGLINTKLIGISTELFDVLSRKSNYEYFNYTGSYVREKIEGYNLLYHLSGTISGSYCDLASEIPHIYYPYLFAPSVYEDKIEYMRKVLKSGLTIGSNKSEECCCVYKSPTEFRERICSDLKELLDIKYGGKWRNNDNRVEFTYDFDIIGNYYKNFQYVVAVENDFHPGWFTEKLINPLLAGSVPIYYAPFEFPDNIINPEACIILKDDYMYKDTNILKEELKKDRSGLEVFTKQAPEVFESYLASIMRVIDEILN